MKYVPVRWITVLLIVVIAFMANNIWLTTLDKNAATLRAKNLTRQSGIPHVVVFAPKAYSHSAYYIYMKDEKGYDKRYVVKEYYP